ncbi:50S ribosomal protein HLP, mitochondrial-like [Prunus avium]|uniref:50S ribosomal protein HLP, mitochondrial-like n=1 Tax=Prunus avium TaxID=42229 RepID=A0A6P5TLU5_PRUAV|nr:50S ribosomal protein HLP, mitochondrial-like [Prunus avium]
MELVTEETKETSAEAGSGGSRFWWDQNMKLHELKQHKTSLEERSPLYFFSVIILFPILLTAIYSIFWKQTLVGHSLMGGLVNNLSGLLRTSHDMTCSPFLSQQQRTFIQMGTILQVADNSGAKKVRCIQALNASKKGARLGDTIIERKHQKEEKKKITGKGAVVYAVVVRAAMQRGRCDGSEVKFDDNAVVLVDKNSRQPLGTRVFGPVPHELRKKKHLKILSLAQHVA